MGEGRFVIKKESSGSVSEKKGESQVEESGEPLIELTGGRVVDVVKGEYFPGEVRLLLQGEKIVGMPGLAGEPTEARADITYSLGGRAVLPGLFNTHCHVHLTLPALLLGFREMKLIKEHGKEQLRKEMADCVARGITTVRDCVTDDLRDTTELRQAIARRDFPGPRLLQSVLVANLGSTWAPKRGLLARLQNQVAGLPFVEYDDPASGVLAFAPEATASEVRDAVDRAIDERGADTIKIYEQRAAKLTFKPNAPLMTEAQLEALAAQAQKRGVPATAHHVSLESFRRLLKVGITSLAHLPLDQPVTDDDLEQLSEAGCLVEPTLTGAYSFCWNLPGTEEKHLSTLERLAAFRDATLEQLVADYWLPVFQPGVLQGIESIRQNKTKLFGLLDLAKALRYHVGYISVGGDNLRRFVERGIPLACGNDGGVPLITVSMIAHELAMLDHVLNTNGTERFSAAEALRTVTLHSARAVGMEDKLGSLAVGKIADIVVVDGDPLTEREAIAAPAAAVFQQGELVFDAMGLRSDL